MIGHPDPTAKTLFGLWTVDVPLEECDFCARPLSFAVRLRNKDFYCCRHHAIVLTQMAARLLSEARVSAEA